MRWLACSLGILMSLPLMFTAPVAAQDNLRMVEMEAAREITPIEGRAKEVIALINGEIEPEAIFSDSFLTALPPEQINTFANGLVAKFGRALRVDRLAPNNGTRSALEVRFERGIAVGGLAILPDEENRISELVFNSVTPIAAADESADKIAADLAALPGTVSAYFGPLDGRNAALAINTDTPLGLGSTFKFYVLAALGKQVAEGQRSWDDTVPLSVQSYPSGMMQDWPQGAPVTLHTLASLMISISDNTATDQLIQVLGRENVFGAMQASGHKAPQLSAPFMTTRELFLLKGGDPARLAAYASGSSEDRLAILKRLETNAPSDEAISAAFAGDPVRIDVEWLASAQDLLGLMRYMRAEADPQVFEIMAINKGIGDEYLREWAFAGYKGGSEPGVRNLTWLLTDADGVDHVLTLGWNNPDADMDTQELMTFAQRLLTLPR